MKQNILNFIVFFPFVAGFLSFLLGRISKQARNVWVCLVAIVEFAAVVRAFLLAATGTLTAGWASFCNLGLGFEMDGFRRIYCVVLAFMWMMTLLFSPEYFAHHHNRNRYYSFNLLTLGATAGMFLAADLYTAFIFFEIMSLTSYTWVIQEETPEAIRAANTYLIIALTGGLVALMGLFLLQSHLGTLQISQLFAAAAACPDKRTLYWAGACLLFGFGAKAGMFPLHIWLPKAHPVAPAPASALLSGILTKAGVFGVLAVSCNVFRYDPAWGRVILVLGTITMVLGALLALFGIDLKRVLACSSLSQIGFILVGIGMMGMLGEENVLAARGTLLHMVNHSTFKLLLFMVAGAVYMNVHMLDLNDIRGFGRHKPFLHFCYLMGALGIGGVPLWSGYVSKTLLHESIVEYTAHLTEAGLPAGGIHLVEWLFLISGGLTLAYMTKLYVAVFIEKNHDTKRQAAFDAKRPCMNGLSMFALGVPALLIPAMGFFPNAVMDRIADIGTGFLHPGELAHSVHYFTWTNLKGAIISVAIAAVVYGLIVRPLLMRRTEKGRVYVNVLPAWMDLEDSVYRPFFRFLLRLLGHAAHYVCDALDFILVLLRRLIFFDQQVKSDDAVSRSLAYRTGRALDRLTAFLNGERLEWDEEGPKAGRMVTRAATRRQRESLVSSAMAYALAFMCLALAAALIYLLVVNF